MLEKVVRQDGYVLSSLPQRHHIQVDDAQPVVQIGPETALAYALGQILVRGGYDAHVHVYGLCRAYAGNGVFLQGAQEHALHLDGHLPYLIQEERAAVRQLEFSFGAGAAGPGEGAAHVAEKLAADEVAGYCRAIYGHKGLVPALARAVYGVGKKLLSRAALTLDEDGAWRSGDLLGKALELHEGLRHAYEVPEGVARGVSACSCGGGLGLALIQGYQHAQALGVGIYRAHVHEILLGLHAGPHQLDLPAHDPFALGNERHQRLQFGANAAQAAVYGLQRGVVIKLVEHVVCKGYGAAVVHHYDYIAGAALAVFVALHGVAHYNVLGDKAGGYDAFRGLYEPEQLHYALIQIVPIGHEHDIARAPVFAVYPEGIAGIGLECVHIVLVAHHPDALGTARGHDRGVRPRVFLAERGPEPYVFRRQLVLQLLIPIAAENVKIYISIEQDRLVFRKHVLHCLVVFRRAAAHQAYVPRNQLLTSLDVLLGDLRQLCAVRVYAVFAAHVSGALQHARKFLSPVQKVSVQGAVPSLALLSQNILSPMSLCVNLLKVYRCRSDILSQSVSRQYTLKFCFVRFCN